MFRSLIRRDHYPYQTLTLISPLSTGSPPKYWNNKKKMKEKKKKSEIPEPDPKLLSEALSSLPPRFTPGDLSTAIAALPDARLAPVLLSSAASLHPHPQHLLSDPLPFLTAVNLLGRHRLFHLLPSLPSPLPLSPSLCRSLLYFYSEARMLSRALSLYSLMRDSPDPSLRPDLPLFNLLLSALLGPDRPSNSFIHHIYMDAVRSLFRQMLDLNVSPDLTTLNLVVRGYVRSLHLNDALRVFHQMIPVYGVSPDAITYGHLVHGLCAQGRTRNAVELYEEMRGKGFRVGERAGNSLASALAMDGEAREAVRVMWEVVGMGRRVEGITARTVVEGLCAEGRATEAERLVVELREREVVDGRMFRELVDGVREALERIRG